MDYRNPKILKPHPISLKLYGEINTDGLRENIEQQGLRVPLIIKEDNTIISGCRRCKAAVELEMDGVPVDVKSYSSDLEEKQAILYYNRYRDKTFSQKMNEAELIKEIVAEEARGKQDQSQRLERAKDGTFQPVTPKSAEQVRAPETATIVAKQVGLGGKDTYRKAKKIWDKAKSGNAAGGGTASQYVRGVARKELGNGQRLYWRSRNERTTHRC